MATNDNKDQLFLFWEMLLLKKCAILLNNHCTSVWGVKWREEAFYETIYVRQEQ